MAMTTQSITSGQEKQIVRFGSDAVEAALKSLALDKDGAQRVIEHGDEFASEIRNAAHAVLQNLSLKGEEVSSNLYIPRGL
ncbi:MAG: hypothetical protein COX90_00105 [Candidatus Nealsonbacteria bacterium CG_4_10_14_0_2_um_filter_38_17]|uniref:Uncharacterized protein n=2 Tax=Candidatus Nealsoniibacteriota TaxID=1817911 RepID=A0A2M7UZA0_9BACT|nr:MAG: hypothetical protein COX90_00105 [Candidatus Nealsonbacteria bacterium CG_4_10_14_0_2_um_filter_38_17]